MIHNEAVLDTDTVTRDEFDNAFWKLKMNKRAASDQIPAECLNSVSNECYGKLEVAIRNDFESSVNPRGFLITVSGPAEEVQDEKMWKVCNASHHFYFVESSVLDQPFENLDHLCRSNQQVTVRFYAAWRHNRSNCCSKKKLRSCLNREENLNLAFIDFRKAFVQVDHAKVLNLLCDRGVKIKCLRVLSNLNTG